MSAQPQDQSSTPVAWSRYERPTEPERSGDLPPWPAAERRVVPLTYDAVVAATREDDAATIEAWVAAQDGMTDGQRLLALSLADMVRGAA